MGRLVCAFALVAAGCTGAAPMTATSTEAIIGGTTDVGDPGVVLLFMTIPGQKDGSLCTGELISPHVVLTAAHCTGGENPSITNATWQVYAGSDFSKATAATMRAVKEAHFNSAFDASDLPAGNDVGVAILRDPLPVPPLKLNRAPIDATLDGKPVRLVGYGLDNAVAQSGAGLKRQTSTTLTDHTGLLLHFGDGVHETCNGDSGGPALMTIDGEEVIVGLTSYGDVSCGRGGFDTRVDAMLAFIDPFVAANDPATPATAPPDMAPASSSPSSSPSEPSGGTAAPPTTPAPTSPPSGSQAGAVGASCQGDADCQSGRCGMSDDGYVCLSVEASATAGGCSVSAAAGNGSPVALFFVAFVLIGARALPRRVRARVRHRHVHARVPQ